MFSHIFKISDCSNSVAQRHMVLTMSSHMYMDQIKPVVSDYASLDICGVTFKLLEH